MSVVISGKKFGNNPMEITVRRDLLSDSGVSKHLTSQEYDRIRDHFGGKIKLSDAEVESLLPHVKHCVECARSLRISQRIRVANVIATAVEPVELPAFFDEQQNLRVTLDLSRDLPGLRIFAESDLVAAEVQERDIATLI